MTEKEQAALLIDSYTNLQRIKAAHDKDTEIEQESHGKVVSLTYYRVFHRIFTEYMAVNGGKHAATFAGYLRELEKA